MEYYYPAVFEKNENGWYSISFPDLIGCFSQGKNLNNALSMAEDGLKSWLSYLLSEDLELPQPSDIEKIPKPKEGFTSIVHVKIKDEKSVRRTVSLPKWMDKKAKEAGLSLSNILQEALKTKI